MLALVTALPAGAHADLIGTLPAAGAVLSEPPDAVALHFDEPVELAFAAISVFDGSGARRDAGPVHHSGDDRTRVAVPVDDLDAGGYAVTWSVTSSDSHPIDGTFTFRVEGPVPAAAPMLAGSNPGAGSILDESPTAVDLEFDMSVDSASIKLFDRSGTRVAAAEAVRVTGAGEVRRLVIEEELAPGGYVVAWEVTSGGERTDGAFTFRIAGEGEAGALERLVAPEGGSTSVGVAQVAVRWMLFLALTMLVGGLAFLASLWPAGFGMQRPARLMWATWATAVVATLAGLAIQGPYASGRDLDAALDGDVVRSMLSTRFGQAGVLRVGFLVGIGAALALASRRAARRPAGARVFTFAGGVLGVAAWATVSVSGHAGTGDLPAVAVVNDVIHLSAASFWLGGLAVVWTCVLRATSLRREELVLAFSQVAFWCVAVIAATGLFASWRQVGSVNALLTTTYGRILVVKVGLFTALIVVAGLSRSWIRRRWAASDQGGDVSGFRRLVGAETSVAMVILVVTALLVASVPGRSAESRPFETEIVAAEVGRSLEVVVDPARAGLVEIHLFVFDSASGAAAGVDDLDGRFRREEVGALEIDFAPAGPGHFIASGFDVPISGRWVLELDGELAGRRFSVSTPIQFR